MLVYLTIYPVSRLDVPENGLKALVRLSNGDMRKALNILQVNILISLVLTAIIHIVSVC